MLSKFIINDKTQTYSLSGDVTTEEIVQFANKLSSEKFQRGESITSSSCAKSYLQNLYCDKRYEIFGVIFLKTNNEIIECRELFRGDIDKAAVYVRQILMDALDLNAKNCLLFHNHPSGNCTPSDADKHITKRIQQGLALCDIDVLDHLIIGGDKVFSFKEELLLP